MAKSLKDIARLSGVSVGTASDILNRGRVHLYRPATCERVLAVSRRHDYRANRFAQAMRSRKTAIVGFATANTTADGMLDNYSIYPFQVGLNKRLAEAGHHVGIVELAELALPGSVVPQVLREQFFSALVVHYGLTPRAVEVARGLAVPLVWWDSGIFEPTGCLYRDEAAASRELTLRLLELGHKRIAYLAGEQNWRRYTAGEATHYSYAQRFEAYRDTLRDRGLREAVVVGYAAEAVADQLTAHRATAAILQGATLSFMLEALGRLGWQLGRDFSVATLDREARIPQRGTVVGGMLYDRFAAGQLAAEMVLTSLADPSQPVPSVTLKPQFDLGQTLAPPIAGRAASQRRKTATV